MFALGAIIGLVVGGISILTVAVIHVEEVEKQNEYLKQQLLEQCADTDINTFNDAEIRKLIKRWTK